MINPPTFGPPRPRRDYGEGHIISRSFYDEVNHKSVANEGTADAAANAAAMNTRDYGEGHIISESFYGSTIHVTDIDESSSSSSNLTGENEDKHGKEDKRNTASNPDVADEGSVDTTSSSSSSSEDKPGDSGKPNEPNEPSNVNNKTSTANKPRPGPSNRQSLRADRSAPRKNLSVSFDKSIDESLSAASQEYDDIIDREFVIPGNHPKKHISDPPADVSLRGKRHHGKPGNTHRKLSPSSSSSSSCLLSVVLSFLSLNHALKCNSQMAIHAWTISLLLIMGSTTASRNEDTLGQSYRPDRFLHDIAKTILRSTWWVACIVESLRYNSALENESCVMMAMICMEWIALLCSNLPITPPPPPSKDTIQTEPSSTNIGTTVIKPSKVPQIQSQQQRKQGGVHYHSQNPNNNMIHSIPNIFSTYGLYIAPFGTYLWFVDKSFLMPYLTTPQLSEDYILSLIQLSYIGRLQAMIFELNICLKSWKMMMMTTITPVSQEME